jgi:tRNA wybutosine-synthesizing protein 3
MIKPCCVLVDKVSWVKRREEALKRFLEDVEIGYADRDIVDFIKLVFTKKSVFTTSSCSGRITIVDTLYPWLREDSYIVFKKHDPVTIDEITEIIKYKPLYRFWLISSGPIIHFIASDLETACRVLFVAREAGFKHSGIISLSEEGIVIEVISGTWTSFILKDNDKVLVNDLGKVVSIANEILIEGKKKLEKLFKMFKDADI